MKINKLTQAQYDRELAAGNIDENSLYLTPDDDYTNDDTLKQISSGVKDTMKKYTKTWKKIFQMRLSIMI